MKKLELQMTFNEVQSFLSQNKKYILTPHQDNTFDTRCRKHTDNHYFDGSNKSLSSSVKKDVYVEYSDEYIVELALHMLMFGEKPMDLYFKSDRTIKDYVTEKDIECMKNEFYPEWSRKVYLEASNSNMLDAYRLDELEYYCFWEHSGKYWEKVTKEFHEKVHTKTIATKNFIVKLAIEHEVSFEDIQKTKI